MIRAAIAAALLLVVLGSARAEDRVVMRDGSDVLGQVESRVDGTLRVRTTKGLVSLAEKDVLRVETLPEPEFFGDDGEKPAKRAEPPTPAPATGADQPARLKTPTRSVPKRRETPAVRLEIEDGTEVRLPDRPTPREETPKLDDDDPRASAIRALLERLGSDEREEREAAAQSILDMWPTSAFALDIALAEGSDRARLEAVHLLRDPKLGDQSNRLRRVLSDKSGRVTVAALRAIRSLRLVALEPDVLRVLDSTTSWPVRQDAARTLERIGGPDTFPIVVALWAAEPDEHRRRRLKRVMREIARVDLGDDPEVWQRAVGEAFMGRRALRDPAAE